MSPVVTKVIGVVQGLDATLDKSADPNIACGVGLAAEVPFGIGNRISPATRIELEEMIIFEEHDGLDNVVKTLQACGDRDLDPAPDDWLDMIELDVNPCDAFIRDHDANAMGFCVDVQFVTKR